MPILAAREYRVPTASAAPTSLAQGPDDALWFAEPRTRKIGRINSAGEIEEVSVPGGSKREPGITAITLGGDGNLWFLDSPGFIGRLNADRTATKFALPSATVVLTSITPGPDGAVWFTEISPPKLGRVSPDGQVTEFDLPPLSEPVASTSGPSESLWLANDRGSLLRVSLNGTVTEMKTKALPHAIALGPDGNVWFTEDRNQSDARVGVVTPSGLMTEFDLPSAGGSPGAIIAGPDRNLWLVLPEANTIARVSLGGLVREYALPTADSGVSSIAFDSSGQAWFTERDANQIGRIKG